MANVKVKIVGEDSATNFEVLRRWFQRGKYTFSVEKEFCVFGSEIGDIKSVSLMSDPHVQWSFQSLEVLAVAQKKLYRFVSVTTTTVNTSVVLKEFKIKKQRQSFMQYCVYETAEGFVLGHKFWSIFFAPFHSSVSRYERLTILLQSLTANLFVNALFYRAFPVNSLVQLVSVATYSWLMSGAFTFGLMQIFKRSIRKEGVVLTDLAKSKRPVISAPTAMKTAALDENEEVSTTQNTTPAHALMKRAKRSQKAQEEANENDADTEAMNKSKKAKKIRTLPAWMRYVAWVIALASILAASYFSWLIILDPDFSGKVWNWLMGSLISTGIDLLVWFPVQLLGKFLAVPILASIFSGGM